MFTTFLITVLFLAAAAVSLSALAVHLFAEAQWKRHPLARCTYLRAASFAHLY